IESVQLPHHAAKIARRLAGDALRYRAFRRRLAETAGWDRERLVRGQSVQYASLVPRREGEGACESGRARRITVQHHRRPRLHFDAHRWHEVLGAIARTDRRFKRDRYGSSVVRRKYLHTGL